MSTWRLLLGDVRTQLQTLTAGSVQCCVTSPPYWGLRDYGHAGQIGAEATPDLYVAALVEVFAEVWRVLREDGTLWLNLGDSYNSSPSNQQNGSMPRNNPEMACRVGAFQSQGRQKREIPGLKAKDLVGIPWRVAFGLQAAGWYLRSDIIWSKPNPMPESVTDRPTKAHEYLFLLAKQERYYYDADAIAEASITGFTRDRARPVGLSVEDEKRGSYGFTSCGITENRNKRTVWSVATQPYSGAHFAVFLEALITPCILAGSKLGDTVLDPFNGSGTTGAVAIRHQRDYIGIELNADYVALARTRIGAVSPLFAVEVA